MNNTSNNLQDAKRFYCPYCNNMRSEMTLEHIIPQAIGGDDRFVIDVCKQCNNTLGSKVDTLLAKTAWLKLQACLIGCSLQRHAKHRGAVTLKNGNKLDGYYWTEEKDKKLRFLFAPNKTQQDGSQWLSESVIKDCSSIPTQINIFREEMVDTRHLEIPPPKQSMTEPAMVKILLGMIYLNEKREIVQSPSFDILREALQGIIPRKLKYKWSKKKIKLENHEHYIEYGCEKAKDFEANVILFGSHSISFKIKNFGQKVSSRQNRWFARPAYDPSINNLDRFRL